MVNRIWYKPALRVILPTVVSVLLFAGAAFGIILPAFHRHIRQRELEKIRDLTRATLHMLEHFHALERAGEMTRPDAQHRAMEVVRAIRHGPEHRNYLWIQDAQGEILMHPYMRELEGLNLGSLVDIGGDALMAQIREVAGTQGNGFIDYAWQWQDEPGRTTPKTSHVRLFGPWDWIVGTGVYLEDVQAQTAAMARQLTGVLLAMLTVMTALASAIIHQGVRAERQRFNAQRALQESEEKYRTLVQHAIDGILLSRDGLAVYANPALHDMLGYEPPGLEGLHFDALLPETPLGRPLMQPRYHQRLQGEQVPSQYDAQLLRRDGHVLDVTVSASLVPLEGRQAVLHVFKDITGRKQAQQALEDKEQQLRQAQKMEAIGRLAGGIAHDFRNQLTVVQGYADLIRKQLVDDDQASQPLDEIRKATQQAVGLTEQLLAFSRRQVLNPVVVDLNDLLAQMCETLTRTIGEHIQLSLGLADTRCCVRVDPSQFQQAIINLVLNARDAMPSGGRLEITTAVEVPSPALASHHPDLPTGPCVVVRVRDEGVGMDAATLQKLFEPFFTTKPVGMGTGLGLSMVHGFVQQSDGAIDVSSTPGQGTTATILLPHVAQSPDPAQPAAPPVALPAGQETVMVCEDNQAVRELVSRILSTCGYRVLACESPRRALDRLQTDGLSVDLLISDVLMPGMSGPQLVQQARQQRPGLRVLLISGHTEHASLPACPIADDTELLRKPFSPSELASSVRRILDTPTRAP